MDIKCDFILSRHEWVYKLWRVFNTSIVGLRGAHYWKAQHRPACT
jgi:hypothetical protein